MYWTVCYWDNCGNSGALWEASGKPKLVGSGGNMVAKLKLKGIDGRAPSGVVFTKTATTNRVALGETLTFEWIIPA